MNIIPQGERRPWLFEAFPKLSGRLPWTRLANTPTPVQRLEHLSRDLGQEVWIKRDDLTATLYGGNKPRKLEFILGQALVERKKSLITLGGLGTNHGLATAIFGKQLGFQTILGLVKQPISPEVRDHLLAFQSLGVKTVYLASWLKAIQWFLISERIHRPRAFFIEPGGSSFLGILGYIDAGLELAMQLQRKELPLPQAIFVAAGSGGTMAGLALGLRLGGIRIQIIGVQVAPRIAANAYSVRRLAHKTWKGLRRLDQQIPEIRLSREDIRMDSGHYGAGYGHATQAGCSARTMLLETEGIQLDLTYTGKAFGALLQQVKKQSPPGPVLFWNTYNSVDLHSIIESANYLNLPKAFHRFFDC